MFANNWYYKKKNLVWIVWTNLWSVAVHILQTEHRFENGILNGDIDLFQPKCLVEHLCVCHALWNKSQYHAFTDREMSVHIQIAHQSLRHGTLFSSNALLPHIWIRLCDQLDTLKCKHCGDMFYHSEHSCMLNHLKACHPILMLALSLIDVVNSYKNNMYLISIKLLKWCKHIINHHTIAAVRMVSINHTPTPLC